MNVFKHFPSGVEPLLAFHDQVLRGESELSARARARERHEASKGSATPYQDFGKMLGS